MPIIARGNLKFIAPLVITVGLLTFALLTPFEWILPFSQRQETCFIYSAVMIYRCNIKALFVPRMSVIQFQELLQEKKWACENITKVEFVDDMVLGNYAVVSLKHSHSTYHVYMAKTVAEKAMSKLQDYKIWCFYTRQCI